MRKSSSSIELGRYLAEAHMRSVLLESTKLSPFGISKSRGPARGVRKPMAAV